ncbi:hypothetical protein [Bacillus kexueae]|uniref:hypothetical protein n=1 Tax=Aeribacillus kexueae TaxID=2078952 RepID=UPI001FAFE87C|nr:hypothetical protein [Bacillus kexueae]
MTRKVVTACSIFGIMFGSAWFVHENTKRTYTNVDQSQVNNIIQTTDAAIVTNRLFEEDVFESFLPREYIRVLPANK